jgi:hypothetical protein
MRRPNEGAEMQRWRAWIVIAAAAAAACGGKSSAPAGPAGGPPTESVAQASAPDEETPAPDGETPAPDGEEPAEEPEPDDDAPSPLRPPVVALEDVMDPIPVPKVQASCLPPGWQFRYTLNRTGGKLVVCGNNAGGVVVGCWGVDANGKLSARPAIPVPGASRGIARGTTCHDGMCWPPAQMGPLQLARLVMHPDGKRAAVLVGNNVSVYDVASKKPISRFRLRKNPGDAPGEHEITNHPVDLFVVGETAFVLGVDVIPGAGLFPYSLQGKALGPEYAGVFLGGVAIDEHKLVLNDTALTELTILDGLDADQARTITRNVPEGPCKLSDDPEILLRQDGYKPGTDKCQDYMLKHYTPYVGATIVSHGKGFIGLGNIELFTLDGNLVETRRVKLAVCSK